MGYGNSLQVNQTSTFSYTMPDRLEALSTLRTELRAWLSRSGVDRDTAEDVVLAAWEVCANAIEHADDPREEVVRIRATVDESRVRIVIDDTGQFVPISDRPNRGLGLLLTEKLSSELEITTSERGTRVALEKALPRATV